MYGDQGRSKLPVYEGCTDECRSLLLSENGVHDHDERTEDDECSVDNNGLTYVLLQETMYTSEHRVIGKQPRQCMTGEFLVEVPVFSFCIQ